MRPETLNLTAWTTCFGNSKKKRLAQMTHSDTRIEQRLSPLDYFFLVFALGFFPLQAQRVLGVISLLIV